MEAPDYYGYDRQRDTVESLRLQLVIHDHDQRNRP
jgi:hypothetical protein